MLPELPDYDPYHRPVKRVKSRWPALWESYTAQSLTPRQRGYLNLTGSEIWNTGLDVDDVIRAALSDWPDFVTVVTSKGARLKYSTEELRHPHLDFFCALWRLYCGK